ncbi:hypothetical protein JCM19992_21050 [Thermostilla marina]
MRTPAQQGFRNDEPIRIGYFGPADIDAPNGGDAWGGALLAVESINADASLRRCELVPFGASSPWDSAAAEIARAIHDKHLRAIVGGIDGASFHLIETVATKARVLLVSGCSTDKSAVLAGVPWVFSILPDESRFASSLSNAVKSHRWRTVWILSDSTHDSRTFCRETERSLDPNDVKIQRKLVCEQANLPREIVSALVEDDPRLIIISAAADLAASWIDQLRHAGCTGAVVVGPLAIRSRFFHAVGDDLRNVWGPHLVNISQADSFARRFYERFGRFPDPTAYATYDAVCLVAAALRRNEQADCITLAQDIRRLAPYRGVSGPLQWDTAGSVDRPVPVQQLTTVKTQLLHSAAR